LAARTYFRGGERNLRPLVRDPMVSRVILEISVPRFFDVMGRSRTVGLIQIHIDAAVQQCWDGTSRRRDLVALAGKAIHQLPPLPLNVFPICKAAKFFGRLGQNASNAIMRPLRAPRARIRSCLANLSASVTSVRPASRAAPQKQGGRISISAPAQVRARRAKLAISQYHQRLGLQWLKLTEEARATGGCPSIFSELSLLM
jgi:hypothetical protein